MEIEAVSEMDAIELVGWENETITQWNGRNINAIRGNHHENRISSIALQRALFDNVQTGYVLCKNEKDSNSKSESRSSNDKSSDPKKADDKESKTEVKNSLSVGGKYEKDNHGHSSQEVHVKHKTVINFENGNSLELSVGGKHDRQVDRNELSDRTSGEIDASYTY
jgi:hypothetical protein